MRLLLTAAPDGRVRGLWDDRLDPRRTFNARPSRASRIEPVGPRDRFVVDFSLYADVSGDETARVCLRQTFDSYDAARDAEVAFLTRRFVTPPTKDVA